MLFRTKPSHVHSLKQSVYCRPMDISSDEDDGIHIVLKEVLSWSKRLECFAKQDPGRARQSN